MLSIELIVDFVEIIVFYFWRRDS